MEVRAYQPADRDACLAVFDTNTPEFFTAPERADFARFLDSPSCTYYVLDHDGAVAGCGGFHIQAEAAAARLVWGMIRRDLHRNGLGRFLLLYRLREISRAGAAMVSLETCQKTEPFFASQGFKTLSRQPDGYAPGLDRVEMALRLTVCA